MRFTDGLWLKRAGVDFRGGVEVAEVLNKDEKTGIDYLVACRHIANRGDSMDGAFRGSFNLISICIRMVVDPVRARARVIWCPQDRS
jgi:hypothetical protein